MLQENEHRLITAAPSVFRAYHIEKRKLALSAYYRRLPLWFRKVLDKTSKVLHINLRPAPFQPIAFGVECNDGWYDLLLRLVIELETEIKFQPFKDRKKYYAVQIKEKFGTLRFYMSTETDRMSDLISKAEDESAITCEVCGAGGNLRSKSGWTRTACSNH